MSKLEQGKIYDLILPVHILSVPSRVVYLGEIFEQQNELKLYESRPNSPDFVNILGLHKEGFISDGVSISTLGEGYYGRMHYVFHLEADRKRFSDLIKKLKKVGLIP